VEHAFRRAKKEGLDERLLAPEVTFSTDFPAAQAYSNAFQPAFAGARRPLMHRHVLRLHVPPTHFEVRWGSVQIRGAISHADCA